MFQHLRFSKAARGNQIFHFGKNERAAYCQTMCDLTKQKNEKSRTFHSLLTQE